ncbi:MAG: NADH-quinone oxidoreductase subunit H, partial [Lentisphaerae bacterium]|nr:NADH-quinone oxidoreductase subunit H [Lentisphaerota bacterium]
MLLALLQLLVFPGFLFLFVFGLAMEFVDRKLYARLQNRIGPPWFQPLADFIKLAAKEDIIPEEAAATMFR